jgi:signal-transduction protein with cAMP-binding, CBS, and nucleotidyltransferase domain
MIPWYTILLFLFNRESLTAIFIRSQLEAIASLGKRRLLQPGQQIIRAGERSNCMYLVCTGVVSCRVGDHEVKKLSSGHSFGDVAVYCDHIYRLHQEHASILGDAEALEKMYVFLFFLAFRECILLMVLAHAV